MRPRNGAKKGNDSATVGSMDNPSAMRPFRLPELGGRAVVVVVVVVVAVVAASVVGVAVVVVIAVVVVSGKPTERRKRMK